MNYIIYWVLIFITFIPSINKSQALTGDKVIGSNGDYKTLSAVIDDINTNGVKGKLRLLIDSDLIESGTHEITTPTLTENNSLIIKPNIGKKPTIYFTTLGGFGDSKSAGLAILGENSNVGNITIDGSNTENGTTKDMTFSINDESDGRFGIYLTGETDNITIKNLNILAPFIMNTKNNSTFTYGIYSSNEFNSTKNADNLSVINCTIGTNEKTFYYSLYSQDVSVGKNASNLSISDNIFYAQGICIYISNIEGTTNIFNNEINAIGHPTGEYAYSTIYGIFLIEWKGILNIENNKISKLHGNPITPKSVFGIYIYNHTNLNHTANIINNFISNFSYNSNNSASDNISVGISLSASNQNVNVYHNTIFMNDITSYKTYGISINNATNQAVSIKNNIIANTANNDSSYVIHLDSEAFNSIKTSDYNDIYPGSFANIANLNGVDYKTLTSWKTASNLDANSISVNPANPFGAEGQLTSLMDLHWVSEPASIFNTIPIAEVTKDIDGSLRSNINTTMGADEFNLTTVVDEEGKNNLPISFQLFQNYPNPFNPTTKIKYTIPNNANKSFGSNVSLKVYDVLGNEITTLVNSIKSAGNYEVDFNAQNLTSGVYFYILKVEEFIKSNKMLLIK